MKKQKLNEKMGGGGRIGLGGINSTGPINTRHMTKYPSGYHTGGYQGNADSQISQRHGLSSTLEEEKEEELDYKEDQNMLEEEEESLYEFFSRIAKLPLNENKKIDEGHCSIDEGHCSVHESSCSMSEKHCDEALKMMEEKELEEMSAGGVGGVATPLGTNAKGKVPTDKERSDFIKLSNPYRVHKK